MKNAKKNIPHFLVLAALGACFAAPMAWMLSSSLQTLPDMFRVPFRWIPDPVQWRNYGAVFSVLPFGRYLANTLLVTIPTMAFTLVSCALVAYGFARFRFRGRDALFTICLATMMLPGQVTMIPMYMLYAKLGWIDTYLPLIVPSLFGSPFYIFLLRQFFLSIPTEYDDAARIDGASRLQILWHVLLPQARPAVITVLLFTFIGSWNDFFGPLVYINTPEKATLTLGLHMLKTQVLGSGQIEWNLLMAASLLVALPNVALFFFAQKYFIRGINVGGLQR
jgi:multiple sugar transport system permease protein